MLSELLNENKHFGGGGVHGVTGDIHTESQSLGLKQGDDEFQDSLGYIVRL